MSNQSRVREFHERFDQPIRTVPELPSEDERNLRYDLLEEEWREYIEAESEHDIVAIADALADMVYIIYGTAITYGINLDAVIGEVHRSNMTKVNPTTGKADYREDGKVEKPDTYEPANIAGVLYEQVRKTIERASEDLCRASRDGAGTAELEVRLNELDRLNWSLAALGHEIAHT